MTKSKLPDGIGLGGVQVSRWTDLDASQIEAMSARNRASHRTVTLQDKGKGGRPKGKAKRAKAPYIPVPTEHAEQCAVIDWWELYAPTKGLDSRLLFAIPNGSNKSIAQAMKFKREGLRPGVLDLMLATPKKGFVMPDGSYGLLGQYASLGLFIEMKRRHGSQTRDDQIKMIALLQGQGYKCVICKGSDEAIKEIMEYVG